MHVNPYLVIEDEKYLVDDFKFGFRQKPNAAGVPIEVPVFQGLHVVIRGHYPGFFLERWACASSQSKLVELVLKPLVLGSGPTRVFTFFDAHLVDFTKNYSEKKNPPVEMILKITAGGVRDSFSKSEYAAPWRETFEKPCTVVAQSTTEEACVDSREDDAVNQVGGRKEIDSEYFFTQYNIEFNKGIAENKKKYLSPNNKKSLRRIFDSIADYYQIEEKDINLIHISYMLATAKHETAHTFNPVKEYGGNSYYEKMYDPVLGKNERRRNLAKFYGNTTQGDGIKYCGRGFVQLTWKDNYKKMKDKFNVDFVNDMDKAMVHELAMKIMIYGMEQGTFTGRKLDNYLNKNKKDYYNARRIINGIDKAEVIAGYAIKMEKCLRLK